MYRIFLCLSVFLAIYARSFSQEDKLTIRTGAGYYMDMFTSDDGPILWMEGGYRLKTGFNLNVRISMASIDWKIRDGLFEDFTTIQLRQMIDLVFSRHIKLTERHYLEPGAGFKLKREYLLKPEVANINNGGSYYQSVRYSDIFYEIGFTLCLDYYYQFENNFYLGLRADSNVIWALGFEGLSVTPLFGFRF